MNQIIVLTVILPLLAAFLLPSISRFSFFVARLTAPLILVFSLAIQLCVLINEKQPFALYFGDFIAPQGIAFHIDQLSLVLAGAVQLFALLMWPWRLPAGLQDRAVKTKQFSLQLLLVASANGLAFSGDLFNLYVFYELLAVATYGLVTVNGIAGHPAGFAASFRYLVISAAGSVLALLGIALIYFLTGTLNFAHLSTLQEALHNPIGLTAFILILIGFGVKAELFPVNSWVPEVYAAAPKKLSGLLAGVISKLAVLIIIKALLFIYPHEESRLFMLVLGLAGVILGELAALRASDFTRMIAWSSVAQLGLVFVAFSIPGEAGVMAGLAVLFHHMLTKSALFLIAEKWGGHLRSLQGQGYQEKLISVIFVLIALSMIGLPPLPGFWSKFLLLTGLAAEQLYLAIFIVLTVTVVEAYYIFRVFNYLYSKQDQPQIHILQHHWFDRLVIAFIAIALLLSIVEIQTLNNAFTVMSEQLLDIDGYADRVLIKTGGGL